VGSVLDRLCGKFRRGYMNLKKVPQLFVATGATQFGERKELSVD
jgi:hypothetical protein